MKKSIPTRHSEQGFSLVEVVVATAIALGLLMIASLAATRLSSQTEQLAERTTLEDTKAHVLQKITTDFKNAGRYLVKVSPPAATATSYRDEVAKDNPLLWWRLDEANGPAIIDSSGQGYDGTTTGTISYGQTGALNSDTDPSVGLQGATMSRISRGPFQSPTGDFSIEWWLKPAVLSNFNQKITTGGWNYWSFQTTSDGAVYCGTDTATRFTPTTIPPGTLTAGQWHHFVYTYTGSTASLYLNGRLLGSRTQTRPQTWTGMDLNDVNGQIDDLSVYFKGLTAERVKAHYIAGVAPPVPENATGLLTPRLPRVKWKSTVYDPISGPVTTISTGLRTLIITADEDFSPTQTESSFKPGISTANTLQVRSGVRSKPKIGDYLLLIDYNAGITALLNVTGDAVEVPSQINPDTTIWKIPVIGVSTTNPAWNIMVSISVDLTSTYPEGSTVVRLSPPIIYYQSGTHLVRQLAQANQTLALGTTRFTIKKDTTTTSNIWTLDTELAGEGVESSTNANWDQRISTQIKLTPEALNPGQ